MEEFFRKSTNKNIDFIIRSNTLSSSELLLKKFFNFSNVHSQKIQASFVVRPEPTYSDSIESQLTAINYSYDLICKRAFNTFSDITAPLTTSISFSTTSTSIYASTEFSSSALFLANSYSNNYWALLALILVIGTTAGNILVCLAIVWERRLQNVTNYFLMSLAVTDLMVAVLVMPLGILTLVKGYFPLGSEHCLTWICLDVLFCTASIMHLCTISVDRYLSLRYPMRFGRNKTRRRVILKIVFVWLLSIAMSLPLSLMYSKNHASRVLVKGTCQIPDPVYKLVGSIFCFYIPLCVMLLTYCLTVRLLARQRQNLGGTNKVTTPGWGSGCLNQTPALERRCTWRQLLKTGHSIASPAGHAHSANSTDTELSTLDTHELWLPESSGITMTALQQFGVEMLKLSRGLESAASSSTASLSKPELYAGPLLPFAPIPLQSNTSPQNSSHNQQLEQFQFRHHFKRAHLQSQMHTTSYHHELQNHHQQLKLTRQQDFSVFEKQKDINNSTKPILLKMGASQNFRAVKRSLESCMADYIPPPNTPISPLLSTRNRSYSLPKNILLQQSVLPITEELSDNTKVTNSQMKTCHSDSEAEKRESGKQPTFSAKESESEYLQFSTICRCPYFGSSRLQNCVKASEVKIISTSKLTSKSHNDIARTSFGGESSLTLGFTAASSSLRPNHSGSLVTIRSIDDGVDLTSPHAPKQKLKISEAASVITWDTGRYRRRGSSFGGAHTSLLLTPSKTGLLTTSAPTIPLKRSATLRVHKNINYSGADMMFGDSLKPKSKSPHSSPCFLQRNPTIRSYHSRNSSVISRNSSRHGRIIRLEQKATQVLGVVFFTFVFLWSPFFVLNLLPTICGDCEDNIDHWVFDLVTWLGYTSSMVNPIFYTIFNKVFRQAFKKVLLCRYASSSV